MKINPLFESIPITDEGIKRIAQSREIFTRLMNDMAALDPDGGREFALFKTKIEEACFFINKSIAKNNEKQPSEAGDGRYVQVSLEVVKGP